MTLVEFNPPEDKNIIQISVKSNDTFYFTPYGGLSKDTYFYTSLYVIALKNYTIKLDDPNLNFNNNDKIIL